MTILGVAFWTAVIFFGACLVVGWFFLPLPPFIPPLFNPLFN